MEEKLFQSMNARSKFLVDYSIVNKENKSAK